ncbi:MAG: hypothetical protein KBF88_04890 [Polyangiaceae bacterium]|nr:hypothetical protein [Polyangiaceae bacterium]
MLLRHFRKLFFLLLWIVFTSVYPYNSWVNNPNENVRTYMTMALVEQHTLILEEIVQRHGWINDMALVPNALRRLSLSEALSKEAVLAAKVPPPYVALGSPDAKHYSVKAPAISYAGVPLYWVYTKISPLLGAPIPTIYSSADDRVTHLRRVTFFLRLFTIQIPCFLFLVWFERFLRKFSKDEVLRYATVASVGIGTNYLAYALMFASHAPFAAAAFLSFGISANAWWQSASSRDRRLGHALAAGFFAGLCTLLEYHALPVSMVLALFAAWVFWRPTRLLALSAGGLFCVAVLCLFQWCAYGNPLTPGHLMVENPAYASKHHEGLFGLSSPDWTVFGELVWNKTYGFFGTSPFMWLAFGAPIFGFVVARGLRRQRRILRTLVWVSIALLGVLTVTVSAANNWRGGWTVGPRYLGAAPPFAGFLALVCLENFSGSSKFRRLLARIAAGGLCIASVFQLGLLGMVFNTLPEGIVRPVPTFLLPALRARFVPHHVGDWIGITGTWPAFVALAAAFIVALLALCPTRTERWFFWSGRVVLSAAFAYAAVVRVAFAEVDPAELTPFFGVNTGRSDAAGLFVNWEPKGRDAISKLREEAERFGPRGPCNWLALADAERELGLDANASYDESRANGHDRSKCPK